jgi:multidrug efflux pump subunit AcrA (membrane-fusion protein)
VASGEPLVRFRSVDEEAQLASVQREFESALVRMLANSLDQSARQTLAGLRAQRDLLATRLSERVIYAAESGTVGDVRVKPGQSVAPGELIASIVRERGRFSVLALLPGHQRPALHEGQQVRLELAGYPYVYHDLTIDRVDQEVIGLSEVRRILGADVADSIPISGPVVVVRAALPDSTFVSGGELYHYFDGMHAIARARLRSERLLTILVPGVRVVAGRPQ